jgi:hypothetical protein
VHASILRCYSFLYGFKGAPPARQRRAGGPDASKRREAIGRGCVIETGATTRTKGRGAVDQLADSGRRQCRALSGGSPDGRAAAAGSAGPHPQVGSTRRYAASMAAPAKTGPGPSSVPGILSPHKITVKGAPCGRVFDGATRHP